MKIHTKFISKLALYIVALFGAITFFQWDESDRENAVVQILPYELNYTFEGKAKSYHDANAWFARLFIASANGQWTECQNDLMSFDEYEKLKSLSDKTPPAQRTYVVAQVFTSKAAKATRCEVHVGDWNEFLKMKQPNDHTARAFNMLKKSESEGYSD